MNVGGCQFRDWNKATITTQFHLLCGAVSLCFWGSRISVTSGISYKGKMKCFTKLIWIVVNPNYEKLNMYPKWSHFRTGPFGMYNVLRTSLTSTFHSIWNTLETNVLMVPHSCTYDKFLPSVQLFQKCSCHAAASRLYTMDWNCISWEGYQFEGCLRGWLKTSFE
jgi:hypothetical protein